MPLSFRRLRLTVIGVLGLALLAGPLAAQSLVRIQNRFRPETWLNTETGSVRAGPIQPTWWSADWILEPVSDAPAFVRLRNRFRADHYIHIEHGRVESGLLGDPGWWSAQWSVEAVPGTNYSRLRNRWKTDQFLHTEHGELESGPIDQGWWSAQWAITASPNAASAPVLPPGSIAVAPQATSASTAAPPPWAADRLAPVELTYRMVSQGNTFDSAHIRLERLSDAARPVIRFTSTTGGMSDAPELDTITVDGATLAPIRVWTRGSASRSVDLRYQGAHVTGHVHFPYNGTLTDRNIDTVLASGTVVDEQVLWSLAALPLAARRMWQITAYSWIGAGAMSLTATVTGDTTITVPAGTFSCWKIQMSGAGIPLTVYITKTAPVVARYEITEPPFAIELVRRTP